MYKLPAEDCNLIDYKFWGKVRKANLRGKKLGFPTANVNLNKNIPEGIYISKTRIKSSIPVVAQNELTNGYTRSKFICKWCIYLSLTFIGKAKTFNEKKFQAETYILDFNEDIYDRWISIELLKKIRENKKFKSAKDLITQMKKDKEIARKFFLTP